MTHRALVARPRPRTRKTEVPISLGGPRSHFPQLRAAGTALYFVMRTSQPQAWSRLTDKRDVYGRAGGLPEDTPGALAPTGYERNYRSTPGDQAE